MIQNSGAVAQQFLANLQQLQERMANTQAQISSGVRINKPSDDPGAVGDVLQIESDIGRVTQVASNLGLVKGEVDTAESSLENATNLLQQAATLATQGATGTLSASDRASLSQQIQQILTNLVSTSQTQFNGLYVFGGDQATAPSYQVNLANANGVDRLVSTSSTRLIQDATGVTFAVSRSAQDIFDHRNPDDSLAGDNVFAAVNSLRVALANNDQTGIETAIGSIKLAQNSLSQQLAFYGGVQNQVANALDVAQKFQTQYQTSLGQLRDTDVASASIDLTQEQTSYSAAIQAEAVVPRTSLFSFLQNG